jgi:hypothetical protein
MLHAPQCTEDCILFLGPTCKSAIDKLHDELGTIENSQTGSMGHILINY